MPSRKAPREVNDKKLLRLCVWTPYTPSGDCGSVATCPVQWWTVLKGGDPRTDQVKKGTTRTPGWQPKERQRPNCHF